LVNTRIHINVAQIIWVSSWKLYTFRNDWY